jgi:hypothetical protein
LEDGDFGQVQNVGIRDIFLKISRNADSTDFAYVLGFTSSKPGHVESVSVLDVDE